ncbi:signal recognition particle-docking protein FtsY [Alloalcanivorax xenomutans]|jgi:fused signal recognition particle receptor|uniref:Signal recognition particle receptor FtsY n=1 Tax=Alloalcanivorax xenomutans TaxID=1094342 RepID=A0A9Q3W8T2_9GAMM|nr:signal recognition particle-docking protein FtsY [Alloalcanivorax xenomutans]ERS10798.1 cell division protein FtsY [Alcanivorax sp. PN-3]KYZ86978.1 signal recognition particle-docking protein FtsY [Alcanivorax sp. KX64203]ARB44185.1 cell division protein FtsY [Alloalcanivorax xenomutans]MCE7511116.1 signal recognition particle-docking protein FtsY [Alloalcanivorax xenomutans]WOD28676.1 signal recognition particle-docking protein FtsY [Alloalcanivorax xenomutans]
MNDEVSRDDDNPAEKEQKKGGFFSRMFRRDREEAAPAGPAADETESSEPASTAPPAERRETTPEPAESAEPEKPVAAPEPPATAPVTSEEEDKAGFWARMKAGMSKTSKNLGKGLADLLVGAKEIDDEIFEEIETQLLVADVGVEATDVIIQALTERVGRQELVDADALYEALQEELRKLLVPVDQPLVINGAHKPHVILMVGVNGVGKTTTIGKLACRFKAEGRNVMLAAGDTFRAAAVEQLQVWGERNDIPVVAQHTGADSASVIYDAVQAAQSRQADVLIADTAGRLHTRGNLMEELSKVTRVMKKLSPEAPHEVLLVLDAGTGQNAINQALEFRETAGVTGLVLTKLDGTAKGGILFALAKRTGLPIRFIGVGERLEDLRPFNAEEFVQALFEDVTS